MSKHSRKILFAHNGPLHVDHTGGFFGIDYTEELKNRYLQLGDDVTFLMRKASAENVGGRLSPISHDGFNFIEVPELLKPLSRITNHKAASRIIESAVRNTDILVARIPSLIARLTIDWAHKLQKPYLVECVACNWDALWNYGLRAKFVAPYYFLMQKKTILQSPHVIYVSNDFLQKRYPTLGESVAISDVQLPSFELKTLHQRIKRIEAHNAQSVMRLVTVGSVSVRYKGQADVIKLLPALRESGIRVEYHLIGSGDQNRLREKSRRLGVEREVIFHGSMSHQDVIDALDKMDIYIKPSRQEGLPRAVIEAMSRGLAVVGSTAGGTPELIDPERRFPPGNVSDMQRALMPLFSAKVRLEEASRNIEKAKQYQQHELEVRRRDFYSKFLGDHGFI